METRTLLRDFQSHNQSRSVYRVDASMVVKAKKIRLLDFGLYSDSSFTTPFESGDKGLSFHPLAGVYSLIKKVSIFNLNGVEIDNLTNCMNNMAMRLTHMENAMQLGINTPLNLTNNTFFNEDSKTISNYNSITSADGLYIDVSFMLNYLNSRDYLAEGFTIIIEWASQAVWAPEVTDPIFISNPTLAIDEMLTLNPSQVDMKPVVFVNIVNDTISMATQSSKTQRLNSYYNLFISKLYYLNNIESNVNTGLGYSSSQNETFELTIDGKKLLSLKGIDTPARKTAFWTDFAGRSCMVNGSNQKLLSPLKIEVAGDNRGIDVLDNHMSYGCVKLDRFIQNDITVSYSRPAGVASNLNVSIIAEVLKIYDPARGALSFVKQ
jgi:hypothetical protein